MSIPHVTSRGTKRESHPPPLWETLQKGNLRLRRQPQPLLVNMFFKFSFLCFSLHLNLDLNLLSHLFIPLNHFVPDFSNIAHSNFANFKLKMIWDGATRRQTLRVTECRTTDNHRTFHSLLLPCNICKTLRFPTTPPPSRSLRPRKMHTQMQTHAHMQPQYPLPLFWPSI